MSVVEPAVIRDPDRELTSIRADESSRYHTLDRVRALAMLQGVVYHTLVFRMFTGGGFSVPLSGSNWWALTAVVSTSSVLAALLLYEAMVRRTPLAMVFGPAGGRKSGGTP